MANRTVKGANTIKGTNPQFLIEKIIRSRIYESRYWKEECFALTAELLVDKALELKYVGGTTAAHVKPTPFLCLLCKMLQIQPEKDIVIEFIKQDEFKYVRCLGAMYLRLTGNSVECYKYLEELLADFRRIKTMNKMGAFQVSHIDEFIDSLLIEDRVCEVILPRLQKRAVLEEQGLLKPRWSALEQDLEEMDKEEEAQRMAAELAKEEEGYESPVPSPPREEKKEKKEKKSKKEKKHKKYKDLDAPEESSRRRENLKMEKALDARARLRQKKAMTAEEMESFCAMYDDIIKAFELQRKEKYEAEDSLLSLAMVMEKTRQKYVDLNSEVIDLRHNNNVLQNELKTISTKYRLARDSLYEETKAKEMLQKEIKDMEGTVALVKDIIFENNQNIKLDESQRNRLVRACSVKRTDSIRATPMKKLIPRRPVAEETFFDETCMSQDDVSFDETLDEEEIQPMTPVFKTPRRGKRSVDTLKMDETNLPEASSTICSSENDSMAKKSKVMEESEPAFKGTVSAVKRRSQGFTKPTGATARRRQSRHFRQSAIMEDSFEVIQEEKTPDTTPDTISNADSFFQTPQIVANTAKPRKLKLDRTSSVCSDKSNRSDLVEHKFTTSRVLTFETCRVCFKGIKFYSKASKCDECKVICHPDCVSKLDITCKDTSVPIEKVTVGPKPLEAFVDKSQKPRIPGAIYYAIHGVDQQLTEEGIYRIPGSTKTLQEIKRKVLFGDVNSVVWADIDVHTLASFVKDFLRCQISEPILTFKLLPQIIEAAKHGYSEVLKKLIKKLPDANRDTIAFIIVHLQNVITNSKKNQMSENALAIAIGPSLVGFTKDKPSAQEIKDAAEYQEIVAENLLRIPRDFYWSLMDVPENNIVANEGADPL